MIDATFADGSAPVTESLMMSVADYNYDRAQLRDLILRVCAEVSVGPDAFAVLERFVDNPGATGIGTVLDCFADVRRQRAQ